MIDIEQQVKELRQRIEVLERLVMALGDKLLTVALHLAKLSERAEVRGHFPKIPVLALDKPFPHV